MLHASVLERKKRMGYAPANLPEKYCVEE